MVIGLTIAISTPAQSAGGAIVVDLGKAKMLKLNQAPDAIVLANPAIADVIMEKNLVLFIIGLTPGETSLHILDSSGQIIMKRPIIVRRQGTRHVSLFNGTKETYLTCSFGGTHGRCSPAPGVKVTRGGSSVIEKPEFVSFIKDLMDRP